MQYSKRIYCVLLCLLSISPLLLTPLFGNRLAVVVTGSMSPAIQVDALILTHRCDWTDVEVGDVVVYWSSPLGAHIVHRVVDKGEDGLITRGDANRFDDPAPVTAENFRGKVVWVGNFLSPLCEAALNNRRLGKCVQFGVLCAWALTLFLLGWILDWAFLGLCLLFPALARCPERGGVRIKPPPSAAPDFSKE